MAGVLKRFANCGFCGRPVVLPRLGLRSISNQGGGRTHFGYETVSEEEKTEKGDAFLTFRNSKIQVNAV